MENNKPTEKIVFAVVESMDFYKRGIEVHYRLVNSRMGAGWGNNEGIRREEHEIFPTKKSLLENL
jgi:hypothetical protein